MHRHDGFSEALITHDIQHLAIGFFDGLHLGHRAVIINQWNQKELNKTCVLTFWPHPLEILSPENAPAMITSMDEKIQILEQWGIGHCCTVPFTKDLAHSDAALFLNWLERHFPKLRTLSVGPNFRFGNRREGTPLSLSRWCEAQGIHFHLSDFILASGAPISSTHIRDLLASGKLNTANQLIGRPYAVSGKVISGKQLGRKIGFPTANIRLQKQLDIPAGVYAARVLLEDGAVIPGALNFGIRPTLVNPDIREHSTEVHLIDWSGNLYGQNIKCELLQHVRPEMKFDSVASLSNQIRKDVAECTTVLNSLNTFKPL